MAIASIALVGLSGAVAGGIIGFVFGFALTSHHDVLRGVRPDTGSRFLLFICRPTAELKPLEVLAMFVLVCTWLVVAFFLLVVPSVAAERLAIDSPSAPLVAYSVFVISAWLLNRFGAHVWRTIA